MAKSQEKSLAGRTWHYYWQATVQHKFLTYATLISTPLVILFREVILPYILAEILGAMVEGPSHEYIVENILPLAIFLIILRFFVSAVLGELRVYWHWKMEIYAMYYLNNLAFETVSAQSMQFHNDRFSGSLVSQTNKFVSSYERLMDDIVWSIVPLVVMTIAIFAVLFNRAPTFAAGLLVLCIVYSIIAFIFYKKIAVVNEKQAELENKQTGQLADSITNITSVKSYARENHERRRFANFTRATANNYAKLLRVNIIRNSFFDVVYVFSTAIVLVFLLFGGEWFGLSAATLILITNYTLSLTGRLWELNNIFKDLNRVFGDAREMTEILDLKDDVVDLPGATELKVSRGAVDFSNITFKHQDARSPIFENFSLTVKPGERIGLVGVSGSGKTTLTKLLLRFADVADGEILIDGQNIKNVKQTTLREAIAYVPQETSLFHRSIAENIAYARPDASREEIIRAAKLANADEFVKDLPDGYDTLVGERGIKLSGGQRQRIAIARAILKDAPILVLDEATSALDSESEALIQSALEHLMKNRTSIVIAHRLSTVANLDRIVVLEDGKIIEQGSHQELLANEAGPYHHLWSRQSGAFLKGDA